MTTSKQIIRIITEVTDYIYNSNPYIISCNFKWNVNEIDLDNGIPECGVYHTVIKLELKWKEGSYSYDIDTECLNYDSYVDYVIGLFKQQYNSTVRNI